MPVFGLNNGMVPIISYNYGAARLDRVRQTFRLTAAVATVIMVAGCAAFNLIPGLLLGFFSPSAEMLSIGTVALRVISCWPCCRRRGCWHRRGFWTWCGSASPSRSWCPWY